MPSWFTGSSVGGWQCDAVAGWSVIFAHADL